MIPLDQLYFILAQLLALALGWYYRNRYGRLDSLHQCERNGRLVLLTSTGVFLSWFVFGHQVVHLVNLTAGSYLLIVGLAPHHQHIAVLIFSCVYLSYLHLDRMFNDFSGYSLDITSPVMIIVQKVTLVAFSMHDGQSEKFKLLAKKDEILSDEQKREFEAKHHVILAQPSALEFVAYIFNFPTVLCGPSTYFDDFIDFVDGRKLKQSQVKQYPSVKWSLLHRLTVCNVCSLLIVFVASRFPICILNEPRFTEANMLTKLLFIVVITSAARWKYYFAWSISEAIGNLAGLGFNGLDDHGSARWDLLNNIDIFNFENSLSLREAIESWNKATDRWLRKLVYERSHPKWRVLATFGLSALWHGFHPGYYLTFMTGALFTIAARNVRRYVRPHFMQGSSKLQLVYHVLTYLSTRIALAYLSFPFVLLEWHSSLQVYRELYFFAHIAALAAWLVLPTLARPQTRGATKTRKQDSTISTETIPLVHYVAQPVSQAIHLPAASSL